MAEDSSNTPLVVGLTIMLGAGILLYKSNPFSAIVFVGMAAFVYHSIIAPSTETTSST
jgi:hypothetical protein